MRIGYLDDDGVAVVVLEDGCIATVQDALDVVATASFGGAAGVVIPAERLSPDFFALKTRLAGDMLQKFVNYGMRAAIAGDFSGYASESFKAFIRESNRGRHIFFKDTVEAAARAISAAAREDRR
jgi:hypothetical protein